MTSAITWVGKLSRWLVWPFSRSEVRVVAPVVAATMLVCGSHFARLLTPEQTLTGATLSSSGPPDWAFGLIGSAAVYLASVHVCRLVFVTIFRATTARPKVLTIAATGLASLALLVVGLVVEQPSDGPPMGDPSGGIVFISTPGLKNFHATISPNDSLVRQKVFDLQITGDMTVDQIDIGVLSSGRARIAGLQTVPDGSIYITTQVLQPSNGMPTERWKVPIFEFPSASGLHVLTTSSATQVSTSGLSHYAPWYVPATSTISVIHLRTSPGSSQRIDEHFSVVLAETYSLKEGNLGEIGCPHELIADVRQFSDRAVADRLFKVPRELSTMQDWSAPDSCSVTVNIGRVTGMVRASEAPPRHYRNEMLTFRQASNFSVRGAAASGQTNLSISNVSWAVESDAVLASLYRALQNPIKALSAGLFITMLGEIAAFYFDNLRPSLRRRSTKAVLGDKRTPVGILPPDQQPTRHRHRRSGDGGIDKNSPES